jgi:hypothetical protein
VVATFDIVSTRRHPAAAEVPGSLIRTQAQPLPDASLNPCTLSLLDAAPGAVVLAATLDGELLYLNAEGRKLLHDSAGERVPLHLYGLFAPPTRQLLIDTIIPECLRSGSWRGATKLLGHDGREIPAMQAFVANRNRRPHREVTVLASVAWDLRRQ